CAPGLPPSPSSSTLPSSSTFPPGAVRARRHLLVPVRSWRSAVTAVTPPAAPAARRYCMVASFMQFLRRERGNHVVKPGATAPEWLRSAFASRPAPLRLSPSSAPPPPPCGKRLPHRPQESSSSDV